MIDHQAPRSTINSSLSTPLLTIINHCFPIVAGCSPPLLMVNCLIHSHIQSLVLARHRCLQLGRVAGSQGPALQFSILRHEDSPIATMPKAFPEWSKFEGGKVTTLLRGTILLAICWGNLSKFEKLPRKVTTDHVPTMCP